MSEKVLTREQIEHIRPSDEWSGPVQRHADDIRALCDLALRAEELQRRLNEAYCPGHLSHDPEFNVQHDNYYCRRCKRGMGNDYYKAAKRAEAAEQRVRELEKNSDIAFGESVVFQVKERNLPEQPLVDQVCGEGK